MDTLKAGLAELYESGDFSDFTITCGELVFKVHKAVVCAQSAYFKTACGKFVEGAENNINLKAIGSGDEDDYVCDDPEAIKLMVDFFYHLDYTAAKVAITRPTTHAAKNPFSEPPETLPDVEDDWWVAQLRTKSKKSKKKSKNTDNNPLMHAKVFAAAVKYCVSALQELAVAKFAKAVETGWNHESVAAAAGVVYNTTKESIRDLRDIVGRTIIDHESLLDKPEIEKVIRANDALNYELLRLKCGKSAVAEKTADGQSDQSITCSECGGFM